MAATTEAPYESFVSRVYHLPLVNDTIDKGYSLVKSNTYTSYAYDKTSAITASLYSATTPITSRLQTPIKLADSYANKTLDIIEARFPYVKEDHKVDDVIKSVRAPADQAVGIAKTYADGIQSRLSPVTEAFQARLTQTSETLAALQTRLSGAIDKVPKDKKSATDTLAAIRKEFEETSAYLQTTAKELPAHAHDAVKPVLDRLSEGYVHVSEEIKKSDKPLVEKAQSVLTYTRGEINPLLQDAISALKELAGRKKAEAEATVDAATK